MNDDQLDQLLARDAAARPTPAEVAEARLMLKRALTRGREDAGTPAAGSDLLRLRRARFIWLGQAAGFALLLALLTPVVPLLHERLDGGTARSTDLVAAVTDGARAMTERVRVRFAPLLPTLPELKLPDPPPSSLFDWFGPVHSPMR